MSGENTKQTPALEVIPPRDKRGGNAQRHGILSAHVPEHERAAYLEHAQAVRSSLGAEGDYLRSRMADRVALTLWRLDRAARYEAALLERRRAEHRAKVADMTPSPLAGLVPGLGRYGNGAEGAARAAWAALERLTGDSARSLQDDPQAVPLYLETERSQALTLEALANGEAVTWGEDTAAHAGVLMFKELEERRVSVSRVLMAALGRKPTRDEVAALRGGVWEWESEELPGLLELFRSELGEGAAGRLREWAEQAGRKAAQLEEGHAQALEAEERSLGLAALPGETDLTTLMRYEAHLERTLHKTLHELEAMNAQAEGGPTLPPLRGEVGGGGE